MNAALGVRFLPAFFAVFRRVDFLAVDFLAAFFEDFFAAVFRLVAIACLPVDVRTCVPCVPPYYRNQQYTTGADLQ
jgi:hypothetical protein